MDYNVNISAFGDHCREINIDESMIIDYTIFDDRDVSFLFYLRNSQLPRLTTCLLEYIDFFNNVNSQNMPIHSQEDLQTTSPLDQVNSSTESIVQILTLNCSDNTYGWYDKLKD